MLEEYLIGNCSPTLASLKTANLFSMPYESEKELSDQIAYWNQEKGSALCCCADMKRRHWCMCAGKHVWKRI